MFVVFALCQFSHFYSVLESDPQFGFEEAKRKLQERPWLVDSYTKWLQRLKITVE